MVSDNKFLILKKNNCDTDFFNDRLTELINHYKKLADTTTDAGEKKRFRDIENRLTRFKTDADTTNIYRANKMDITMIHDTDSYNLIGLEEFFEVSRHNLSFVSFNFNKIYPQDKFGDIETELAAYWREDFPFDFYLRADTSDSVGIKSSGNVEIEGEVESIELSQDAENFHINTNIRVIGFIK